MNELPAYVSFTFACCVIVAFGFIYYAVNRASVKNTNVPIFVTTFMSVWIFIISVLTTMDFFTDFESFPPRIFYGLFIVIITIFTLFMIPSSRQFLARMPISTLTYIHIIRVPVEIVLWWLFMFHMVDESMTFKGLNYDILSGISAPFAGLFFVGLKSKSNFAAIIWNLIALGLLINIVAHAILATPHFQDPSVQSPNVAIFYFPYVLLPLFIVPVVLFSHLVSLYQLIFIKKEIMRAA